MRERILCTTAALLASFGAAVAQGQQPAGAVFVATNGVQHNAVMMYTRGTDGHLTPVGSFDTGGRGQGGVNDPLQSNYSVSLTADHQFLLVTNAGSSDISVFRVQAQSLQLVGTTPSGGGNPVGLALSGSLVYVVNTGGSYHTAGFRLSDAGQLTPIAGSEHTLSSLDTGASAAAFTPDGSKLVVLERLTNKIDVLPVRADGSTGDPVFNSSLGYEPFGLEFSPTGTLLVAEASPDSPIGSSSSYRVNADNTLTGISGRISSSGAAPCWVATNGRYVWVSNTVSGTLGAYRIDASGALSTIGALAYQSPAQEVTFPPLPSSTSFPLDLALSGDQKFLYVVYSVNAQVVAYSVGDDGSLRQVDAAAAGQPQTGVEGLAAF